VLVTTDAATTYFDLALERLHKVKETQLEPIRRAARLCAEKISKDGLIFLFGSGHSRFLCDEMAPRQGCFVGFVPNQCPVGDCLLGLEGLDWKTGPLSTVTGSMIINMIRCETARLLLAGGYQPTMLPSHQFAAEASAEEQLEKYYRVYRKSLSRLYSD
jgi:uncharacterized phosphosugar-binding protein